MTILSKIPAEHTSLPPGVTPHLAEAGFVLRPNFERIDELKREGARLTAATPLLAARIPNPQEFGTGPAVGGAMFIIKWENSDTVRLPNTVNTRPFLATLQEMIDRDYAFGGGNGFAMGFRASRRVAQAGEAHQSHQPEWHDHASWGPHRAQLASDVLGTRFKLAGQEVAAPDGSVVIMDEKTQHCTPRAVIETLRTFVAFISLEPRYAHRYLSDQENVNPLDRIMASQPYGTYDPKALDAYWHQSAQRVIAAQRQTQTSTGAITPLSFQPV